MKVLVAFVFVAVLAFVNARPDGYTTKYDNVDLDEILKSDRLINNYFKCLMDTQKCTPDGQELKNILPDALKTGCAKCSDKHKKGSSKMIHFLIEKKRDLWDQLEAKYDPSGDYRKKYDAELKKEGIKL